jgi:hypothetical protein
MQAVHVYNEWFRHHIFFLPSLTIYILKIYGGEDKYCNFLHITRGLCEFFSQKYGPAGYLSVWAI